MMTLRRDCSRANLRPFYRSSRKRTALVVASRYDHLLKSVPLIIHCFFHHTDVNILYGQEVKRSGKRVAATTTTPLIRHTILSQRAPAPSWALPTTAPSMVAWQMKKGNEIEHGLLNVVSYPSKKHGGNLDTKTVDFFSIRNALI